jgi:hypothetical protein
MPIDRRHFRRFNLPIYAVIQYQDGPYRCLEAVSLINLSSGGALLAMERHLEFGSPVVLRFLELPGSEEESVELKTIIPEIGSREHYPGEVLEPRSETQARIGAHVAIRFTRPLVINSRAIPHSRWQRRP